MNIPVTQAIEAGTHNGGADAILKKLQNFPADVAEVQPKTSRGDRKSCQNDLNLKPRIKHGSVSEATLTA